MRRGMKRAEMNEVSCRGCGNRWQYDAPLVLCRCPKCGSLDTYYRNRPPQTKMMHRGRGQRRIVISLRPTAQGIIHLDLADNHETPHTA